MKKRRLATAAGAVVILLILGLALPAFAQADAGADEGMPQWVRELLPIGILLAVVTIVIARLPRIDIGHTEAFRSRRVANWLPLGLTYAFLYMGRYNLAAVKDIGALTVEQYGTVFGVGAGVYGVSFLLNGPLADRWGGRTTILIASAGSAVCNALMGLFVLQGWTENIATNFAILYGANMYFQSFGAVSIVKVNSAWFHVRERGVFGGIFGILISLGVYFAFDWGHRIVNAWSYEWVFFIPAMILAVFFVLDTLLVRDNPSEAGHDDFDTGDASSGDDGPRKPVLEVMKTMVRNPVIVTIALIEFCSGFLRQAIMHWYRDYAKGLSAMETFVYENWGMLLCVAGITGGMFAGIISDRMFMSRRGPVSAVLYAMMLVGAALCVPFLGIPWAVGYLVILMSMAIIGVHGMLSGTASQDFGGKKNAGVAVGLIDGMVYLGTVLQSFLYGFTLPKKGTAEAAQSGEWMIWPLAMIPIAVIGLLLSLKVWNAAPKPNQHQKKPAEKAG